jgi:uncharacterized protein
MTQHRLDRIRALNRIGARAPISAYGAGGFRFGDLHHIGSVAILASGIYAVNMPTLATLDAASLIPFLSGKDAADFVLLGTGMGQAFPDAATRAAFDAAGIGLEPMATGAACRTFNVLYAEQRHFAALLIAV